MNPDEYRRLKYVWLDGDVETDTELEELEPTGEPDDEVDEEG